MKLFMKFVRTHHSELEIAFNQYDMERSGWLGTEDLKSALKEAGLRLTSVSNFNVDLDKAFLKKPKKY